MGMDNEKAHMSEQIQELTLLLMYLTSWQESSTPGLRRKPHKTDDTLLRRCWKGYDFSILERLEEQNLICGEGGKKPIVFTAEGVNTTRVSNFFIEIRVVSYAENLDLLGFSVFLYFHAVFVK